MHRNSVAPFRRAVAVASLLAAAAQAEEVVVAFGAEPTQVEPTRATAGVDAYFVSLFYEQLLNVDPALQRVNWLAESWSFDPAGADHVLSVTLRPGVKFHNGDTLSAHDFRFAYERQRDPLSRAAGRFRYVRDLVVHDDRRFDVVFDEPDAAFVPWNLALWAVPRRHFEAVGEVGMQTHPVGTGPWKFVSRKPREELVVERFEDYWNAAATPRAKRLVIKIIPEDTTRVAAFKTGEVDWIDAVPPAQVQDFTRMPGVRTVSLPGPNNLYIGMNATDPATRSPTCASGAPSPTRSTSMPSWSTSSTDRASARPNSRPAPSGTTRRSSPTPTIPTGRAPCSRRPATRAASASTATT